LSIITENQMCESVASMRVTIGMSKRRSCMLTDLTLLTWRREAQHLAADAHLSSYSAKPGRRRRRKKLTTERLPLLRQCKPD
jgi:hypothetical protein